MKNYVISGKLNRPHMEDTFVINEKKNYYSVCDGHGGKFSSYFISYNFFPYLEEMLKKKDSKTSFKNFLINTCYDLDVILYRSIDDKKVEEHTLKCSKNKIDILNCMLLSLDKKNKIDTSGTTLSSVFLLNNYLHFLNIGDSITCLVKNSKRLYLNEIHKPTNQNEKSRILQNSIILNNRINGRINISRTFGDFVYKNFDNYNNSPVVAIPDVFSIDINVLKNNNSWVLIASDGLYLNISINTIISTINYLLLCEFDPTLICDLIMNYLKYINNKDNVTFIIILIDSIKIKEEEKYFLNKFIEIQKSIININIKNKKLISTEYKENYCFEYISKLDVKEELRFILYLCKNYILFDKLV